MEKNVPSFTPELAETLIKIPEVQAFIKDAVDKAVLGTKEDIVDYSNLSQEDADYLNREITNTTSDTNLPGVAKLEDVLYRSDNADEQNKTESRPFGAIVKELNAEHSFIWTPKVKLPEEEQSESKDLFTDGESREATDSVKVERLINELAIKISLEPTVRDAEGAEAKNDARFKILTELNEHRGLSEDDVYAVTIRSEYIDSEIAKAYERLATPIDGANADAQTTDGTQKPIDATIPLKSAEELEAEKQAQAKAEELAWLQETMLKVEADLIIKRNALAKLSVQMRGRFQDNHDDEMTNEYNKALEEYRFVFDKSAGFAEDIYFLKGEDDTTFLQHLQIGVVKEHNEFTKAEVVAYTELNPKIAKAAKGWSKLGLVKRTLASTGSGAFMTTAMGGLFALTGVAGVIAGGAYLSVKAAKTIGMYKLNKAKTSLNQFQGNAIHDNLVLNANLATKEGAENATEHLHNVIESRVKADQKRNRKSLGLVVGGTVVGAVLGATVGDWALDKIHGNGGKGSGLVGSRTPNSSATTAPLESSTTPTTVRPIIPRTETPTTTSRIPASADRVPNIPKPGVDQMPPVVTPETIETAQLQLHVPNGEGFENSIQQQFGLNDTQSRAAYEAMRPYLADQANTYIVNGDIRISSPGEMMLNQQASDALRHFLDTIEEEELLPATA